MAGVVAESISVTFLYRVARLPSLIDILEKYMDRMSILYVNTPSYIAQQMMALFCMAIFNEKAYRV